MDEITTPQDDPSARGSAKGSVLVDPSHPLARRQLLKLLASGAGLAVVAAACGSTGSKSSGSTATTATTGPSATTATTATTAASSTSSGSIGEIPEETAGPYPADGTNGPNVLTQSGVVRRDIRSSFGSYSGTADGVPMTIQLKIVEARTGAAKSGAAVYLWHCDKQGRYSLYSQGATNQNYLRGVQEAGPDGTVTFTSVYPACYDGRWPHIHFEVYPTLAEATAAGTPTATSQIALTEDVSDTVYATSGYETSKTNMAKVSLSTDMVFRDGAALETPTVSGSVSAGYVVAMTVGV
jgi:protocatechuate 3,4-dioxygenase beta subunit